MAVIDLAGYVAQIKDDAIEHGFHVHGESHSIETYSLTQTWEIELHPENACGGPVDLIMTIEADPRIMLAFEDEIVYLPDDEEPLDQFYLPLTFKWALPPLTNAPDLLVLTMDLAGIGGPQFPLEASAVDSYPNATDSPQRRLEITARRSISLTGILSGRQTTCPMIESAMKVAEYLLNKTDEWTS